MVKILANISLMAHVAEVNLHTIHPPFVVIQKILVFSC